MLPIGIISVLVIMSVKILRRNHRGDPQPNDDIEPEQYKLWVANYFEHVMDNINITISSYGFLINFYPIYDKLHPSIGTP